MLGVIILLGFFILQHHLMTTALSPCFLLPLVSQIQWLHVPRSVYGPIVLFYCSDSPMARCFSYRNFVVNLDVQQTKCSSLTLFFFLKYLGCNLLFWSVWAAITIPQTTGLINNRNLILEAGSPRSSCWQIQCWLIDSYLLTVSSHIRRGKKAFQNLIVRPLGSNHLPKT